MQKLATDAPTCGTSINTLLFQGSWKKGEGLRTYSKKLPNKNDEGVKFLRTRVAAGQK